MSYGFLHGTQVETGYGARAVEQLRCGDRVLTLAGKLERIQWVGHTTLSAREVARAPMMRPVRLRRATFGDMSPAWDLIVAPEQGILLSFGAGQAASRVVPAQDLPLGASRLPVLHDLRFTNLLLCAGGMMLANGVWCPSVAVTETVDIAGYETHYAPDRLAS